MVTSSTATAVLFLAAVLVGSGCARVVDLAPTPSAPTAPPPIGQEPGRSGVEQELERRLAEVEQALPEVTEAARPELEAERLALVVALTELDPSSGGDVDAADPLLAAARAAVARAREEASEEEERHEERQQETLALARQLAEERSRMQEERSREALKQQLGEEKKAKKKQEARRGPSCAPGDPLCSDLGGDGDIDLPPVEKEAFDEPDEPRDFHGHGKVGAARVAYEPTPTGVMAEIRRHFGRVSACIGPELRQQELQLRVVVLLDTRGLLRQPRVEGSALDAVTRECVADVFRTMRVADPPGTSRVLSVPLWLAAEP